jgi:palmitoyltransferase
MWWLGTVRANWEQVFGPRAWTWFRESFLHMLPLALLCLTLCVASILMMDGLLVPIGSMKDKGLDYPLNPRFNADGQWLPRRQWPSSLR